MKKLICTMLALMTALLLALPALAADFSASGLTASGTAQQLGKAKDSGGKKITVRVPAENPVVDGESPLTGEPFFGDTNLVLANIDTHPRALPHWGVAAADIIYELPIQADGSTRSLALFLTEHPDSAGPIRSARVPMASLREMWGGTYCFYGYQGGRDSNNVKDWVTANSARKKFAAPEYLNGMTKNSQWFPRSSDQSHVAPYNVRMDMNAVLSGGTAQANLHPFIFTDEPLDRGEDVNGIIISYKQTNPAYVSAYQYNEATGLYDRYRNGAPYTDGNTGEACAYANVIVLRTDISWASGNPSRPVIRLNGQGVCEIFQSGKYIRGTWVRDCTETKNLKNRMVFLDENGDELPMQRGKTFIQIVDNGQPVVVLADQKIEGSVEPQEQRLTIGTGAAKTSKPRTTRTPKPTATPAPTATPEPTQAPTEAPSGEVTPPPETGEPEQKPEGGESNPPEQSESKPEQKPEGGESTPPEKDEPEQKPEGGESNPPEKDEPEQKPEDGESNPPEQNPPEQSESKPEQNPPEQSESKPEQNPPEKSESKPESGDEAKSEPPAESKAEEAAPAANEPAPASEPAPAGEPAPAESTSDEG